MHVLLRVRVLLLLVRRGLGLGLRLRLRVGVVRRRGILGLRRPRRRAHTLHLRSRGLRRRRRLLMLLDGHGDARWQIAALVGLVGILLVGRQRGRRLLLLLLGGRPGPLVHMANNLLRLFGGWAGAILEVEILEARKTEVLWWGRGVAVAGSRGHRPDDEDDALALVDG
ncbi:hypothetical protein GGX14DRAFT_419350, partial [Mycena pura]